MTRSQSSTPLAAPERRTVVVNGEARIVVRAQGQGPVIVILPSLGRGVEDYDAVAAGLIVEGFRVLRPQPRGIGDSTGPLEEATLETFAGDVAAVIEAEGVGPVIVAGHAFGNFVARMLATIRPDVVRGVAVVAGSPGWTPEGVNPIDDTVRQSIFKAGDAALPEAERLMHLQRAFFAPGNDPSVWLDGWNPETKKLQSAAQSRSSAQKYFAAGSAPVLDLQAEEDTIARKGFRHVLKAALGPRCTVRVIPNAGHALIPEQPQAVIRHLADWARSLDGVGRTMDWIEAGGVVLRYELAGRSGLPIVLIHEMGGTLETWDFVAPSLAHRHRVLRMDLRNYGLSEQVPGPTGIAEQSADIANLLDALGIAEKVAIAGCAVGAAVAIHFAAHHPERTAALFPLSPATFLPPERRPIALERADDLERIGIRPTIKERIDVSYPPDMRSDAQRFEDVRRRRLAGSPHGTAAQTRMLAGLDLSAELAAIRCPTLVLAGRRDGDRPPEMVGPNVAERIPGARFKTVDSVHFMPLHAPEIVYREITGFLAEHGLG